MIKHVHYLVITWTITSQLERIYRHNELSATHDEVDEPDGSWRIIVVQSECKTELTHHVVVCIFGRHEENVSNLVSKV